MRILHIINDLRVGGAERLLVDLTPRLAAEPDISVDVVALGPSPSPSFLEETLVKSDAIPTTLHPAEVRLRSFKQAGLLAERMQQGDGYDLVHVQLFPAQLWAAIAVSRLPARKRPVLITTEQNTYNRRRKALFRPLDTWMYGRFDHIIAISQGTEDALVEWVPACKGRIHIIPNAIEVSRFVNVTPADKTATLGVSGDTPVAVCVGRLETQKDHATLLTALAQVPGLHLALVGDGELRPELEAQTKSLNLTDRVHFLGRRGDIPSLLAMSDIYVQPSRWEGFGIAAVEAMASGLPAVLSDVPGLREVVDDAGLRFPVGDAAALADRLNQLLRNPDEGKRLGALGRERSQQFSLENCTAAHVALYKEAVRQRRG